MNISSGSSGLAAALTNPTHLAKQKGNLVNDYPVKFRGVEYIDAETAYQKVKRTSEWMNLDGLKSLMVEIMVCKFIQHPRLIEAVMKNGGVEFLKTCSHRVVGGRWEGIGMQSPFIQCLVEAFKKVTGA